MPWAVPQSHGLGGKAVVGRGDPAAPPRRWAAAVVVLIASRSRFTIQRRVQYKLGPVAPSIE